MNRHGSQDSKDEKASSSHDEQCTSMQAMDGTHGEHKTHIDSLEGKSRVEDERMWLRALWRGQVKQDANSINLL